FLAVNERSAFKTALGVAMCILSPVPAIVFSELSDILSETLGPVLMFIIIAIAVGLFISAGANKKPFSYLEKEGIDTAYGVDGMLKEKQSQFSPVHTKNLIIGVALFILSIIPPIITGEIFDFASDIGASMLFAMVAVGVLLIVKSSLIKDGFSILLEEDGFTREKKSREREIGSITGSFWLIVTAGFLAYSFITSDWGRSWIVFPIAALLTPIVHNIEKNIKSK
ncbi:MAG: XRE family transcriptional regulator, partial [Ruminococcus sp.]|nr:XRE family transcriptional regulator [Ruminococcus sp.]